MGCQLKWYINTVHPFSSFLNNIDGILFWLLRLTVTYMSLILALVNLYLVGAKPLERSMVKMEEAMDEVSTLKLANTA